MPVINLKSSIPFLKERFLNGGPYVRRWALEALKARWAELDEDTQLTIKFEKPSPDSYFHA